MSEDLPRGFGGLAPGTQVAGYQIADQVGRGGMAVVYRARDVRLDRWVALKIMSSELVRDDGFRQRFIRESRTAAAVDHPHIIPIFEAGESDGVLFIAMRFVNGQDVRRLLQREGALPAVRAAGIVGQVASALDAAHARGLVHRDVKPANMLLAEPTGNGADDHVYLSDFGVSKQALSSSAITSTGQFLGTLDYVAPEQIEGHPLDGRADLYSLGCAAFELLSGAPPFKRDQGLAVLYAQLSASAPLLTASRPDLPHAVDQVLAKAMAKAPEARFDTCLDFAAALHQSLGLAPATRPRGAVAQPGPVRPAGQPRPVQAGPVRSGQAGMAAAGPGAGAAAAGAAGAAAAGAAWPPTQTAYRQPAQQSTITGGVGPGAAPPAGDQAPGHQAHGNPARAPQDQGYQGYQGQAYQGQAYQGQAHQGQAYQGQAYQGQGYPGQGTPGPGYQAPGYPQQPYPPRGYPPEPPGRRPGARLAIVVAACVAVLAIAGGTFAVLRIGVFTHPAASGGTAAGAHSSVPGSGSGSAPSTSSPAPSATGQSTPPGPAVVAGPAATVRHYFAAINRHDYRRAWALGGMNLASSYSAFKDGFTGTAHDGVTIMSVSGDVVSARLDALQTDGTTKVFQGTYTVQSGVITQASVRQIS